MFTFCHVKQEVLMPLKSNLKISIIQILLISVLLIGCEETNKVNSTQPNIVIILADDMGYSDLGCYGSEINTPNLDKLAKGGLRFTRFYNSARCSPSRAALLTGLYPHQAGVGYLTSSWAEHHRTTLGAPEYLDHLTENSVTIAEVLKSAGYKTYLSGKWHVGQQKPHWPYYRGFDKSIVLLEGYHYFDPDQVQFAMNDSIFKPDPDNFYSTDYFTDNAVSFIDQHTNEAPFLLYLAYTAPHSPIHAPEEALAQYQGKYMKGWDSLRVERYKKMKTLGLIDEQASLSPRHKHIPAWNSLSEQEKQEWDRRMSVYAAQISIMDKGIGKVINKLKAKSELNNTLIMFMSDNGGASAPRNRGKPGAKIGSPDSWQSYGAWANLSNTPFRLFKRFVHEGGIATPLIVHWPNGITRSPDDFVHNNSHLIDIMSTCIDVSGASYPTVYNGNQITSTPGKSLVPYFNHEDLPDKKPIYWEHEGNRGMIWGKWKIVAHCEQSWELYDLESGRTELHDLAGERPEQLEELKLMWQQWADEANVVSWTKSGGCYIVHDYRDGYDGK